MNDTSKNEKSGVLREQHGKAIASQGNQIKKVNDHAFKVKSQSGNGFYKFKATLNSMI